MPAPGGAAANAALATISRATLFSRAGADAFLGSLEAYNAEHALHATAGHQPALSAWGWVACGQDDSMTMSSDLSGVDRSAVSLYIPALYFPVAHNMSVYATRGARRFPVLHGCSPRVSIFTRTAGALDDSQRHAAVSPLSRPPRPPRRRTPSLPPRRHNPPAPHPSPLIRTVNAPSSDSPAHTVRILMNTVRPAGAVLARVLGKARIFFMVGDAVSYVHVWDYLKGMGLRIPPAFMPVAQRTASLLVRTLLAAPGATVHVLSAPIGALMRDGAGLAAGGTAWVAEGAGAFFTDVDKGATQVLRLVVQQPAAPAAAVAAAAAAAAAAARSAASAANSLVISMTSLRLVTLGELSSSSNSAARGKDSRFFIVLTLLTTG